MDSLRRTVRFFVGVIAVAVIAACTGSSPSQPSAGETPQPPTVSVSPDIVVTGSPDGRPVPSEDSACDDAQGDGVRFELSGVQVRRTGAMVSVEWTLGGDIPARGDAQYRFDAANLDGSRPVQYVVAYRDGTQTGHYVRDMRTGKRTTLAGTVGLNDSELTGAFPAPEGLGSKFRYSVSTVLAGKVIDRCPEGAGTVLYDR